MKKLKMILMLLAAACMLSASVYGANAVSYTASDSPGAAPDADGSVDVWTVTGVDGANRSYLKDLQDGNTNMWAIWDLDGDEDGTYATHTFAGGALTIGQSVSIDYAHNTHVYDGRSIGIRLLEDTNTEVEYAFFGGNLNYSKYDTGTAVYELTDKQYDNFDIYQVVFTLTGSNSYAMTVSEGSITDAGYKPSEDGNPDVGGIIASWTGTFTGSSITGIQVFTEGGNDSDQWFDNLAIENSKPELVSPTLGLLDIDPAGLMMEWIGAVDPNIASVVGYTIYIDPNETEVTNLNAAQMDYFDESIPGSQTTYEPDPDLAYDTPYFWRVVETVQYVYKTPGDVNDIASDVWSFTTKLADAPPVVDAGPKFITTTDLAATPFALKGSLTDDGVTSVTTGWQAFDVALGGGLTTKVTFADATDPNTTVTVSEAGSYVLKLTATDGYNPSVSDQKELVVLDDACQAIKSTGNWVANYYDRNGDCVVDLADFSVFALEWLGSTALDQIDESDVSVNDPDNAEQLVVEYWLNVAGTDVNDLIADPRYPASADGAFFIADEFRTPSDSGDNFGRRVYGYIVPPVTGDYTFYIASDDQSRLFLSADTTPVDTDPALGNQIAEVPVDPTDILGAGWSNVDEWDKYPEQTSAPISLTAGQYYYVEALHKEGGYGDHLSVAWTVPGTSEIVVIPGTALRYTAP